MPIGELPCSNCRNLSQGIAAHSTWDRREDEEPAKETKQGYGEELTTAVAAHFARRLRRSRGLNTFALSISDLGDIG